MNSCLFACRQEGLTGVFFEVRNAAMSSEESLISSGHLSLSALSFKVEQNGIGTSRAYSSCVDVPLADSSGNNGGQLKGKLVIIVPAEGERLFAAKSMQTMQQHGSMVTRSQRARALFASNEAEQYVVRSFYAGSKSRRRWERNVGPCVCRP